MKKVLGIGNALVDILVHIDNDKILDRLGLQKGGMEMIDAQRKREILEEISGMPQTMATGGSTSNTIHGLARLGATAGYIGKVGNDELGRLFLQECERFGVIPHLIESNEDTGVAITFISPNAERTFATYLGAAATMQPEQVDAKILEDYDLIHIEGYLIFNHELILDVCQKAKACGLQISMDMASYNLIESNLDFVKMLLHDYVDIIFANEEEAKAFTGVEQVEALHKLSEDCPVAIVKVGKDGSYIKMDGEVTAIAPVDATRIDTTGAGDIYAAGFLYGLVNGYSAQKSGNLASYLSARLIEYVGAKLPDEEWQKLKKEEL
jgi:sugar/nucleoside kinase (ribokinase family)